MDVQMRAVAERERYGDEQAPLGSYAAFVAAYTAAFAGALLAARAAGRQLPTPSLGDLALFGVATHKLSRLLAKDKVTAALRAPFTEYDEKGGPAEVEERPRGEGTRRAVGELITCPYCLDQWVAAAFLVGSVFAPRATRLTAGVFATVAVADFLQIGYKAGQKIL
jgi:Protein of unknown function (DUF1360)